MKNPHLEYSEGTLVLRGISSGILRTLFTEPLWKWDSRAGLWRTGALHYRMVIERFKYKGWNVVFAPEVPLIRDNRASHSTPLPDKSLIDSVPRWTKVTLSRHNLPALRPEQEKAVSRWLPTGLGVVEMPTGTGKTEVALALLHCLQRSTLIVSPVRDLMYQWHQRIKNAFDYDAGIVGDGEFDIRPITVTTYDSACIHMQKFGACFYLVVFDECHHLPGRFFREAALLSAAPCRLGLSATLRRADGRHTELDELIAPVVYRLPLSRVKGKTLAEYNVVRIPVHLSPVEQKRYDDMSEKIRSYMIKKRKEVPGYRWKDLLAESGNDREARIVQKAFYTKQSIEDRAEEKMRILEDVFRLHLGARIIVFTGSNAMARDVSLRFLIPCLLSHCKKEERHEILSGFADGAYPAIVANRVLDEGVDVPEAKVAVVLGGLSSTRQAVQRLGRVLRKKGNEQAVLYEVVCKDTREVERSRRRRRSDAYKKKRTTSNNTT